MKAATIWPLCCFKAHVEDNSIRQLWCRSRARAPGRSLMPEARIQVQCNVASSPESIESVEMEEKLTSATSFCIRGARVEDIWQIADTHCSTFMPNQGLLMDFAFRFDRMLVLLGTLPMDQKKFLVAVEEENHDRTPPASSFRVSGILTIDNVGEFLPRRRPSGRRRTGIAYVSNVAVRHQRRRKGIAKKLLRESEELARSWGCRSIALHCDENNSGAVALYKAEGYRVVNIPRNAKWPQPKGLPGSSFLFMMKLLRLCS